VRLALGILVVLAVSAVMVGAMLLIRRRAPEGGYFSDGDRASGVFGVLATGFTLLLGFVIFLAFTKYDGSRAGAEAEALAVFQLFETSQLMPQDSRTELAGEVEWSEPSGSPSRSCSPRAIWVASRSRRTFVGASRSPRSTCSRSLATSLCASSISSVRIVRTTLPPIVGQDAAVRGGRYAAEVVLARRDGTPRL
jgi:hypothetical protein